MKVITVTSLLVSLSQVTFAHYMFGHFWLNGIRSEKWQYIREVAPKDTGYYNLSNPADYEEAQLYPLRDITVAQMTCGLDAFKSAKKTQTATVIAGSEVGFAPIKVFQGGNADIYHYGPASAWLSRAPNDDVENYDGTGDWFKIAYFGPSDNVTWSALYKQGGNFTIPKTTPPGKYLLRFEHLRPYSVEQTAELYINCAQVNIVGPGGGTPSQFARFPGTYEWSDPGIFIKREWDWNLYYPGVERGGLLNYVPPGPPIWTG